MIKLSILIPMFNASKYIERCLESIVKQGIAAEDYEVIVVNDGSTDNSELIVKQFINNRPNIQLINQANMGADSTRNKMLELAKGEFIYFIDADDYLAYNCLGYFLTFGIDNNLQVVGFKTIHTCNSELRDLDRPIKYNNVPKIITGHQFLKKYPEHRTEIWWFLVRRVYLKKNLIHFEDSQGNGTGDVIFTVKALLNANRMVYFDIALHRYFQSEDSILRTKSNEKNEILIADMFTMVCNFDRLVKDYQNSAQFADFPMMDYLKARRGTMVFYLIHQMLLRKINLKQLKKYVKEMKRINIYPVNYSINNLLNLQYVSLKQKLLDKIILNEHLLYIASILYKLR